MILTQVYVGFETQYLGRLFLYPVLWSMKTILEQKHLDQMKARKGKNEKNEDNKNKNNRLSIQWPVLRIMVIVFNSSFDIQTQTYSNTEKMIQSSNLSPALQHSSSKLVRTKSAGFHFLLVAIVASAACIFSFFLQWYGFLIFYPPMWARFITKLLFLIMFHQTPISYMKTYATNMTFFFGGGGGGGGCTVMKTLHKMEESTEYCTEPTLYTNLVQAISATQPLHNRISSFLVKSTFWH